MESLKVAEILRSELQRRRQRNARFSMRAFAMSLKIDSGSLSQIMSERRHPSRHMTTALLKRLGLADTECEEIAVNLELTLRQHRVLRQVAKLQVRPSSRHIARRLRLSVDRVNAALTQLLYKESIRMVSREKWIVNAVRE
jgi:DNA-binding CsgD family transcriptional regulator